MPHVRSVLAVVGGRVWSSGEAFVKVDTAFELIVEDVGNVNRKQM